MSDIMLSEKFLVDVDYSIVYFKRKRCRKIVEVFCGEIKRSMSDKNSHMPSRQNMINTKSNTVYSVNYAQCFVVFYFPFTP